jgi:hypothetical protein
LPSFIAYPGYLPTLYKISGVHNAKIAILYSISRIFAYLGQNIRSPTMLKLPSFIAYPGYLPTLDKISGVHNAKIAILYSKSRIFAYLGPNNNSIGFSNIGE